MTPTLLYLDTARLGRMSPGARRAHDDFSRLAAREAGSPFFDHFLRAGAGDWPDSVAASYPGLAGWRGVGRLKALIRRLTGAAEDHPVLLAHRSAQLMKLATRLFYGRCRNVLVTDLGWPGWHSVLEGEARRLGRGFTTVALRDGVLRHGWTDDEVVRVVADRYRQAGCDGAFVCAVSNLGVRLPVARLARALRAEREPRLVVVDGAQELNHLPADLGPEHCDLYLAGCHKWVGAAHPLAVGVYGRRRTRGLIDTRLAELIESGEIDDPLLCHAARVEAGRTDSVAETLALLPLFTGHGAVEDALSTPCEPADTGAAAELARGAAWSAFAPTPALRSSILLVRAASPNVQTMLPAQLREHFGRHGVTLTAYPGGVVRLSLPHARLGAEEGEVLRRSLEAAHSL